MDDGASGQRHPTEILGRRVIEVCPDCDGEGILWACDDNVTTHWAVRCERCNCVGYMLDLPIDPQQSDQGDIPF